MLTGTRVAAGGGEKGSDWVYFEGTQFPDCLDVTHETKETRMTPRFVS